MSSLLTVKLRRDLRASWSRYALMVTAVAVSLTAFAAVLFAWSAAGRETERAYLSTEPASATILLDQPVAADRMAALAAAAAERPGVLAASGRTQFDTDLQVNDEPRDVPLHVFVAPPEDLTIATFFPEQATWPPAPGEVFIGRDSLALLDVDVGDTVAVQSPNGDPLQLRVAGTVYDPSLAPAPQEQTGRAYLSTTALAAPGGSALLDQLKIQVTDPGQDTPSRERDAIVAAAADLGEWLQREHGLAIREIQVPEPYAHPHQAQADALLLSLLGGGAAALLLSTILTASMLNNLFARQIPQIGIMKAIGAGSGRIARLYLGMTLLVAAASTLLALGPAIALGRVAVGYILGFLGIEQTSIAAPGWTYLVVLAVGLGLPPLMTLVPLLKASRITVRAAIDHHGLGAAPTAASGMLARLSRLRRVDRGLLMALRNTVRRPARFALSVGLLACAGMVFVAGMSLSTGTEAIAEEQQAQRDWDIDVQLAGPAARDTVTALVQQVPGVRAVDAVRVTPTGIAQPGQIPVTRTYPDQGHGRISVTALPAQALSAVPGTLLEGRWLAPGDTGAVVLNQITRESSLPAVQTGDTVQLLIDGTTTTWTVAGLVEQREGGGGGVYTTADGLAAALGQPPQVNQLRITTDRHDEPTRQAVAAAVNTALADAGIEVSSAASISRSEAVSAGHLGPVILILLGIALPLGVIGVIALASTMSANVLDRTREFGVMHAIGAQPKAVRRIVVTEGVLLALTSCVVAAIPTLALTAALGAGLGNLFFSAPTALPHLHPRRSNLARARRARRRTRHRHRRTPCLPPHRPRIPRPPLAGALERAGEPSSPPAAPPLRRRPQSAAPWIEAMWRRYDRTDNCDDAGNWAGT